MQIGLLFSTDLLMVISGLTAGTGATWPIVRANVYIVDIDHVLTLYTP